MKPLFLFLSFIALFPLSAAEMKVSDAESARKAVRDAKPGDVIVLASGEWRDVDLRLDGEGTADQPVTIRAEEPGKTIITGASRVRLGGSHLVVSGLFFLNLSGANADWLEFRIDSKRRANFCRVTDCAFLESPDFVAKEAENRWIGLYGEGNQLDRCSIEGKKDKGATVVVWLGDSDPGRHRIRANHFGERPRLGKNGGETIRVGDSRTMKQRAECLVEDNYFYRCDGETECISNKSGGNTYRGNWFVETQGTLTLRHGSDCLVEGNVFLGKKRKQTGGIRVIGSGHRIIGNRLEGLEGDGFRTALCFVNGIPDSPDNGYHQVVGAEVRDNVVVDCGESLLIGYNDVDEATLAPQDLHFEGNLIIARDGSPAVRVDLPSTGTAWKLNRIVGEIIGTDELDGMRGGASALPELPQQPVYGPGWRTEKQ
jgi:poly(beta-D-mannuronate) lyase